MRGVGSQLVANDGGADRRSVAPDEDHAGASDCRTTLNDRVAIIMPQSHNIEVSARQRPEALRRAVLDVIGLKLSKEELAILAGRLRFDKDQPAASQQQVANGLGVSQPHVSNLERDLLHKLERAAERRRDDRASAEALHDAVEALEASVASVRNTLPPRPLKIKLSKRPSR